MKFRHLASMSAVALGFAFSSTVAVAADYPSKPIKIMVGFSAGGGTDTTARGFASFVHEVPEMNGMPAVVVNKPGGSGMIAAKVVKDGKADGYTLYMINHGTFTITDMKSFGKAPVQPLEDFELFGCMTRLVTSLQVHADSPYKTANDLVEAAKKSDKKFRWANSSPGSMHALVGQVFLDSLGIKHQPVPFKGGSKARNALLAKKVDFAFNGIHLAAGFPKIRNLGVPLDERDPANKDVPTFKEQGLPATNIYGPMCLWGKKGMPADVSAKLKAAVKTVADLKGFKRFMKKQKLAAGYLSQEDGVASAKAMYAKLMPVVEKAFKK